MLWQGSPASAIVKAVPHYHIDEAVLRGVTVPVLVVRPTGVVVRTSPGEAAPLPLLRDSSTCATAPVGRPRDSDQPRPTPGQRSAVLSP